MNRRDRGRWRDLLLGVGLLFGVAACTWQGIKPDGTGPRRLYIGGETVHIDDDRIAAVAAPYLTASFFDVDIEGLQAELSRQPWLDDVSVSRHWPDGVVVHVTEHQPIAFWGERGVLAADGHVFVPATRPQGLVRLDGPDRAGLTVYAEYRQLATMLAGQDVGIARLALDARGSWSATLDTGLELRLGRDALAARMQRFVDYALGDSRARQALADAGYVDLRYGDGFAVGGQRAAGDTDNDQEKVDEQAA